MSIYNVAIIGLGMGYSHLQAVEANARTRVAAICDVDSEKAHRIAQQHDVPLVVEDYRELVSNGDIDIVIVASPDNFHCEQTIALLTAGKHVLCEKPMAPTVDECERMVAAAERSGRKLMIGHIVRFTPIFQTVKQLVDEGELGEVFYIGTDYQHNYEKIGGWRFDPKLARHVFLGGGCHAVDLMRWFLNDDIVEVTAVANHIALPQSPTDDCIIANYTTAANRLGRVFVSSGCHRPYNIGLEVYGTRGTALASNVDMQAKLWLERVSGLGGQWITVPTHVDNHPTQTQLAHFITCIDRDQRPLIDGREGMLNVQAALNAIHASQAHEVVKISK